MTTIQTEPQQEVGEEELRDLWLSRLMFGWLADARLGTSHFTETRSFEEFCAAWKSALSAADRAEEGV